MRAISAFRSSRSARCCRYGTTARASAEVKQLALARAATLHRKADALEAMRATLLDLAERCHGDDRPDCPIIDRLASGQGG